MLKEHACAPWGVSSVSHHMDKFKHSFKTCFDLFWSAGELTRTLVIKLDELKGVLANPNESTPSRVSSLPKLHK